MISRRLQNLGAQYGREILGNFIDQEIPFIMPNATLVTIFAGGNDVNTITSALGGGAGGADRVGYINSQVTAFGQDFADTAPSGPRPRALRAHRVAESAEHGGDAVSRERDARPAGRAAQMLSVGHDENGVQPADVERRARGRLDV